MVFVFDVLSASVFKSGELNNIESTPVKLDEKLAIETLKVNLKKVLE